MEGQDINFKEILIHPHEEPNLDDINNIFINAKKDFEFLDKNITIAANNYNELLITTKTRINNIKEILNAEKERQQDINILCNKYSDFASILNLTKENFKGNLTFNDNVLQAQTVLNKKINYKIESIDGNGYEGNSYVYLNNSFLKNTLDTSNSKNINDNNLSTAYEYSRITTNNSIQDVPSLFNKDSIEAECSITLSSKEYFNHIEIHTEREDLILYKVYTSLDGLTYQLDKEYNIPINNKVENYNDSSYIYGTGIITITKTKYVKLVFKSNGYTNDELAFTKVFYDNNTNNKYSKDEEIIKKTVLVKAAKRHVIKLNEISLYSNSYNKGMIISNELITAPIKCISLYCNEYINTDYEIDNNVDYYFIINGIEFKVTPINSHRNGKKIIRTSFQLYKSESIQYLNESIKSAKLKIVIKTANSNITPYISNIKILIGGE